jgi:hypothetical protein
MERCCEFMIENMMKVNGIQWNKEALLRVENKVYRHEGYSW